MNSLDGGSLAPLRYDAMPQQGLAVLQLTMVDFREARIVATDGLSAEAVSASQAAMDAIKGWIMAA